MALVTLTDVSLSFGGPPLLDRINLQIGSGERIGIVGRNGTGKSSLLKVLSGELPPDAGSVIYQQGTVVARLEQEVPVDTTGNIFSHVAAGLGRPGEILARLDEIEKNADDSEDVETERDLLHQELDAESEWRLHQTVSTIIDRLGLDGRAEVRSLSGGTRRRVMLGRALVKDPDILLLDEPTNHLDIETITWLETFFLGFERTIIFVTHDRVFLQRLSQRIIELDRGQLADWTCSYDIFLERKQALLDAEDCQQAVFDKKLAQEEAWLRQGIKARRTRNEGRVRALKEMRRQRAARRDRTGSVRLNLQDAERSGVKVIEVADISYAYGDRPLVRNFSTTIVRGDKIGIIGPNGSGKTTLLQLLLGQITPQHGTVNLGTNIEINYFDQLREQLDENATVKEAVADGNETVRINGESRHIISYLQDFLFSPDRARSPVRALSGGERSRLLLARLFTRPCNVLVMDEPTNDLDAETLELLESLLVEFTGTLLLVSHDRAFLNNVVTSTLVLEGDGRIGEYIGGYDDYLSQRPALEETPSPKQKKERPRAAKPEKFSQKESRELSALPETIETLEAEQTGLVARLADPDLYQREPETVTSANARIAELEKELALLYRRWEELEEKKSRLG